MKNWIAGGGKRISGEIRVAGDKSISHRALMLSAIAEGTTTIKGFLEGLDCLATLNAFKDMGVVIERTGNEVKVVGKGLYGLNEPQKPLDFGNSGTAMRLMAGLLAGQKFNSYLDGDNSLRKRPMGRVIKPLEEMGAEIESNNGLAPLKIWGQNLKAINYLMPVASAQLKSCLLLAGLYAEGESKISELATTRDHSERMLESFGVEITKEGKTLTIKGKQQLKSPELIEIPADISSAAFFIAAALIAPNSELLLKDVGINPTRSAVIDIFKDMGGNIELKNQRFFGKEPVADIFVKSSELFGINIAKSLVSNAIDEFPIIFVVAACAKGITKAEGLEELKVKESDRLGNMYNNLKNLGVNCVLGDNSLEITGNPENPFKAGAINSYGDHRIAMSFAVASLRAEGKIKILDCANVETSFPNFFELSNTIGLKIQEAKMRNIITIDGPSGVGKGTLAKALAEKYNLEYLDSGAIYRIAAVLLQKKNLLDFDEDAQIWEIENSTVNFVLDDKEIIAYLNGEKIESGVLRSEETAVIASKLAAKPRIRAALMDMQQNYGGDKDLVTDGRDMGTVIFPEAKVKFFLDASPEVRAQRRCEQLIRRGMEIDVEKVKKELCDRDFRDRKRTIAPLKPADDSIVIHTAYIDVDEVFSKMEKSIPKDFFS